MQKLDFKASYDYLKTKVTFRDMANLCGVQVKQNKHILCCFHHESTPSLMCFDVDSGEGNFFCYGGCGGGDILKFFSKHENCTPGVALSRLAKAFKLDLITQKELPSQFKERRAKMLDTKDKSKKFNAEKRVKQVVVANECQEIWNQTTAVSRVPYLEMKKLNHTETRSWGELLVVPVKDINENVISLQYIFPDGGKTFKSGGKLFGGMLRLGKENENFAYLAEGWASGASVHVSTGKTVYICFSSKNIDTVAKQLKEKYPKMRLLLAGDQDAPGMQHHQPAVYPGKQDWDWSDVFMAYGPKKVRELLEDVPTGQLIFPR
jgi:phage/plasmid primase-like uncharacterized protein